MQAVSLGTFLLSPVLNRLCVFICANATQIGKPTGREPYAFILEALVQLISVWFRPS